MLQSKSMAAEQTAAITQACPNCGEIIDTTSADPLSRVECPKCGEKVRVERSFNNFVLLETLGIGGMGTVYKARDTLLERDVALKLLRGDLGAEIDQTARLQQEARVAASVNHPNVIQVFSSGIDHGQFYLVMELVDCGSLDDKIEEQKRLPEELVLETGIQAAKGLRAAYANGLIHRDVKPANILFADERTAKIGDFGLAGVAAEEAEHRGEIWGTPYYVAPERLKNEPEDFRSDIYSLGATLFHALAGTAPIEGETNSATALHELKTRPLDLRKLVPNVSADTAKVLARMIAPDPAKRFSSYDEVVAALEHAYGVLTGSEEFVGRKRRRRLLVGLAILLLALIGVGTWAWISKQRARSMLSALSARAERLVALAPLEGRLSEAQRELGQVRYAKDYVKAKEAFARIAADAQKKQPIYDWARLQQGLAAMVGNESSQARQAFNDIVNAGQTGFANEDVDLGKFFVETAGKLSGNGSIPADIKLDPANHEAFALFAFAIKDVDERDVANAEPLLKRFLNAKPGEKFAWIAGYKTLAQKYLDDCELYDDWKKEGDEAKDTAALARHLENTKNIVSKRRFKMRTAISEQVYDAAKSLPRQINDQKKAESTNREEERKLLAQQLAQKKPQWLADWKKKLIDDLNRTHYSGNIPGRDGVQYTGILGANPNTITMQIPYGKAEVPWSNMAPASLLAISTSFIKPNAPDAAERQWLCAVYANETNQLDAAKKLAEDAAKSKPEFQEQAALLFPH